MKHYLENIVDQSIELKNPRTKHEILGKCTEELGEMATIVNKPHKEHDEPLQSECVDLINAAVDLAWLDFQEKNIDQLDGNIELCKQSFICVMEEAQTKKLSKWATNYLKWCRANDETE